MSVDGDDAWRDDLTQQEAAEDHRDSLTQPDRAAKASMILRRLTDGGLYPEHSVTLGFNPADRDPKTIGRGSTANVQLALDPTVRQQVVKRIHAAYICLASGIYIYAFGETEVNEARVPITPEGTKPQGPQLVLLKDGDVIRFGIKHVLDSGDSVAYNNMKYVAVGTCGTGTHTSRRKKGAPSGLAVGKTAALAALEKVVRRVQSAESPSQLDGIFQLGLRECQRAVAGKRQRVYESTTPPGSPPPSGDMPDGISYSISGIGGSTVKRMRFAGEIEKGPGKGSGKGSDKGFSKGFGKGSGKGSGKGFGSGSDKGSGMGLGKGYENGNSRAAAGGGKGGGKVNGKGVGKGKGTKRSAKQILGIAAKRKWRRQQQEQQWHGGW